MPPHTRLITLLHAASACLMLCCRAMLTLMLTRAALLLPAVTRYLICRLRATLPPRVTPCLIFAICRYSAIMALPCLRYAAMMRYFFFYHAISLYATTIFVANITICHIVGALPRCYAFLRFRVFDAMPC